MTLGEDRVRVAFNPSADSDVEILKNRAAELIDKVSEVRDAKEASFLGRADRPSKVAEVHRLSALAMTAFEEGAMWAVKAATA